MNTNTKLKIVAIPLSGLFAFCTIASNADASQYKKIVNGKEVVVHTSAIPVILHRLVPPQHGRHVTQKEISGGSQPQSKSIPVIRKR
jgi:hypothetical protein